MARKRQRLKDIVVGQVDYAWWQRIHDCHSGHGHQTHPAWEGFLTHLFETGLNRVGPPAGALVQVAPLLDTVARRRITLSVAANGHQRQAIENLCITTGYRPDQMVAVLIRSGYDHEC
jgi:hypothetical protein